jgi:ferric-dicitrate binding protein FerR (iron transport regulator)
MALNATDPERLREAERWSDELGRFSDREAQLERARAAFLSHAREGATSTRLWQSRFAWGLGLAAGLAGAFVAMQSFTEPSFTAATKPSFTVVDSGQAQAVDGIVGAKLSAESGDERVLTFWDQSRARLRPGASVTVTALNERGATLELAAGETELDITHRSDSRWAVVAGSFEVSVLGTRFIVRRPAGDERLFVHVLEGAVLVRGRCLDRERSVSAGQREMFECPSEPKAAASASAGPVTRAVPSASTASTVPRPIATLERPLEGASALRSEVEDTEAIRAAVSTDPARALELIRRARLAHPRPVLSEERDAFEVLALHATGRRVEAAQKAASVLRRSPTSPFSARVRSVLAHPATP